MAEASEEELQEYYFCRIDFDAHDHVFVERALADYRAACRSGEHDDMDAEWHPAIEEDYSLDYDLPEYDTVEDGGTAGAGDGDCDHLWRRVPAIATGVNRRSRRHRPPLVRLGGGM